MNKTITSLIIGIIILLACDATDQEKTPPPYMITRDLDKIKKEGVLKALISYSGTSYFLYRGRPMGFEYELLERLADSLGLKLELRVADDLDNMLELLNNGEADIVAHGLSITTERKKEAAFTDYLYLTHQVLVQKKPDNWRQLTWAEIQKSLIQDPIELIGDTVSVRKNTSYFLRLKNLSNEIGGEIIIDTLEGNLSTNRIIKMVADGDLKYTIADDNLASINASYYPDLDVKVQVSFSQRIAWAVRLNSPKLLEATNNWIEKERKKVDYYVIYNRYFKNIRDFRRRVKSDFYSLNNKQISKYDSLIKQYADSINWDWRLLASLIYQESRFNPKARSWAGAKGLMQMMPVAARQMGVKNRLNPPDNIRGGTKYLELLHGKFDSVKDSVQRLKFAIAAYNCGYYHVIDAQKLAEVKGLNKTEWDDNVEKMILELSYPQNYKHEVVEYGYVRGIEPFVYVEQIFDRYEHYLKLAE
jgi:membrane-bound lytic murein transglycosylase F